MSDLESYLVYAGLALAGAASGLRWLRVAQREHYIPGFTTLFAVRWWTSSPPNLALLLAATLSSIAVQVEPALLFVPILVSATGPIGLGVRGRTSDLRWTRRMTRVSILAAFVFALTCASIGAGGLPPGLLGLAIVAIPIWVDLSLAILRPFEGAMSARFIRKARSKLDSVNPLVVAITGSFGKTSTKNFAFQMISPARNALMSPASFNNALGLAKTINERLSSGTEVFVAEMGTYGKGEIASICSWMKPKISAITAVGPVHLERMKTLENIRDAKWEIFEDADIAILNWDDPLLREKAGSLEARGKRVIRCSIQDPDADVYARESALGVEVAVRGVVVGTAPKSATFPINLAVALAIADACGVSLTVIGSTLTDLQVPEHRASVARSESGVTVIDDTYNANPQGARRAIELLRKEPGSGKRVIVTPGLVELGHRQHEENSAFAETAKEVADVMVVVGRTNRAALQKGFGAGRIHFCRTRDDAVAWVKSNLKEGDAVLYENDLPDHYP